MRRQLLTATTLTLMLLLLLPIAHAAFAYSFTYGEFNKDTPTWKSVDKTRTAWQIIIDNHLTYTTISSAHAKVRFSNATTNSTFPFDFNAHLYGEQWGFEIWVATKVDPTSADWAKIGGYNGIDFGDPVYLTLDQNGYLDVGNKTDLDAYISDFALGNFELAYVGALGGGVNFTAGEQVATAGYITVEIDDPSISVSLDIAIEIIYATIPLVFTVAVIGVIIKMFKQVSK